MPNCTIAVLRSQSFGKGDLTKYFEQFGIIVDMCISNEGSPKQLILITYSSSDEAQRAFTNGYKLPDGISYKHRLLFDFMIVRMAQQPNKGGSSSEQDKQETSQDSSNVASVDQGVSATSKGGPLSLQENMPKDTNRDTATSVSFIAIKKKING